MAKRGDINIKTGSKPYKIRVFVQAIIFIIFIFLLLFADPLTERDKTVNIFLRLSPLSAIGAMVAAREFIFLYWPAIVILLASVFLGRFFCGWICPLGTTLDITDKLLKSQRRKISYCKY